ncbi:MAG: NF038143 family protein, partial [Desulfomicrobium sp.]|nr:NF038143 family protein [Desulfomicrobium sp.]
ESLLAIRSSALSEDGHISFAGQYASELDVRQSDVLHAIRHDPTSRPRLDDFVDNYLVSRRHAMEAALAAMVEDSRVDARQLLKKAGDIPPAAKLLYLEWVTLLIDHYQVLLDADGDCHEDLARNGYKNKRGYISAWTSLNDAERAFNMALLPDVDGDSEDILNVIQKMNAGIVHLRYQDAEAVFPHETN